MIIHVRFVEFKLVEIIPALLCVFLLASCGVGIFPLQERSGPPAGDDGTAGPSGGPTITSITPQTASFAGGNTVTIAGTNLSLPTEILIGGVPCTSYNTNATGTEISCIVGASATAGAPVDVQVNFGNGVSRTMSGAFTYVETAFGNGFDGSLTISSAGIIDVSTNVTMITPRVFSAARRITTIETSAGKRIDLASSFTSDEFRANDEILWVVIGSGASLSCASDLQRGKFGFSRLVSVDTSLSRLVLNTPISTSPTTINNSIMSANTSNPEFCAIQVVRVPNFKDLTVEGGASISVASFSYTGGTGGIIAMRVSGLLTLTGGPFFTVEGKGFSGGLQGSFTSTKGDATQGIGPTGSTGDTANNGNGGGSVLDISGGGGGNGGSGGAGGGGSGGLGGSATSCPTGSSCLFFGGGGGGGTSPTGGNGGGILALFANKISGNLNLKASGNPANSSLGGNGAGGGAGGSVLMKANEISSGVVSIFAMGGQGSDTVSGPSGRGGGGGGGGIIQAFSCTATLPVGDVSRGLGGTGGGTNSGNNGIAGNTTIQPQCQ